MAEDNDYPLMLYRDGSMLEWDGETYDYLIVNDADEAKAAKADGYSVAKPDKKAKAAKPKAD